MKRALRKAELRAHMRALLRTAVREDAPVLAGLRAFLAARPELQVVAVFAALPGEVDVLPLVTEGLGRQWVYPKIQGERLTLHQVQEPHRELAAGAFGILEPAAQTPAVEAARIDAFLCPGLAFDSRGGRLGRGRGFYDRLLAGARPGALRVGVCYAFQNVPEVFAEPHDIPMDLVIAGPPPG